MRALRAAPLAVAAALIALPLAMSAPAGASHGPARLLVKGVEYDLTLSRDTLAPGQAIIEFQNAGQDPHNLVIKRDGGAGKARTTGAPTKPGEVDDIVTKLKPGAKYVLFCSMKHHRAKGMVAHISVKG
ncbi:MAG: hypothetical protein QOJ01_2498 [Solirubrobacterales bacterium]|jgi:plastocyanin|nr:hypothetical protein [Solirubrobacterales bacterium]